MHLEIIEKLKNLLIPLLDEMNLVLVDVTVRRQVRDFYLEILVDRPRGGIIVDECTAVNRRLNDQLEKDNVIPDNYYLEVSSPGLDRPLKTKEDFLRVIDREVQFFLLAKVDEELEHIGIVKDVQDDRVIVFVNDNELAIPLENIDKGLQVI